MVLPLVIALPAFVLSGDDNARSREYSKKKKDKKSMCHKYSCVRCICFHSSHAYIWPILPPYHLLVQKSYEVAVDTVITTGFKHASALALRECGPRLFYPSIYCPFVDVSSSSIIR